jgi:hypothetical protein
MSVADRWRQGWRRLLKAARADPDGNVDEKGRSPSTWQGFVWDLSPGTVAPNRDGVLAPTPDDPAWVAQVGDNELEAFAAAERIRRQDAQAAVATIEGKASRLLTPIVALLTGTVALVAFELHAAATRTGGDKTLPLIGGVFGAAGAALLLVAALHAIDADTRVGIYRGSRPQDLLAGRRDILRAEAQGTALAGWVAINKSTRVMYARAAFSKAVALIGAALLLGGATLLTSHADKPSPTRSCVNSQAQSSDC